jgi:hypothetical protein
MAELFLVCFLAYACTMNAIGFWLLHLLSPPDPPDKHG